MLTSQEAPWVRYIEIDEETGNRVLRADTPREIREKYEEYLSQRRKKPGEMLPK